MTVFSELAMRPHADIPGVRGWNAGIPARLVLTIGATALLLVGANLATPLYPLLQERLGLGPFAVTLTFSSYVLALIMGLVLYGHWSDHLGRRAALVLAVVVGLVGEIVFATADGLGALMAGRSLQGAAVAMAIGASGAALRELLPGHPRWASRFTLLASTGGVALGPIAGGYLATFGEPTRTPFMVHALLMVVMLVPLWLVRARPAIAPTPGHYAVLRPQKPRLSTAVRSQFWVASLVGFLSFALFGFCLSLGPGYFAQATGVESALGAGTLASLVLLGSAGIQLLAPARGSSLPGSLLAMALATMSIVVAAETGQLWMLCAATLGAGIAQGIAFQAAFHHLSVSLPAKESARVFSSVYVVTYLGSAVPVLGLGALTGILGITASTWWFVSVIAGGCLLLAGAALRVSRAVDA